MIIINNQQLIDLIKPSLPIRAYPVPGLLKHLRQQFPEEEFSTKTEIEIHNVVNLADEGGVGCEVLPAGRSSEDAKTVLLCSITHLKIKKGEPYYAEIIKYQTKRLKRLERQNKRF